MKTLTILGRRWFQKTYGNTYHTADIFIDGALVHTLSVSYGYGEMYLQNAFEWLEKTGHINPPRPRSKTHNIPQAPFRWAQEHGVTFTHSVVDVSRRKDLNAPK